MRRTDRDHTFWPKDTAVILGLSKGLGVRVGEVINAYAVSLGLPVACSDDDLVLPGAGALPVSSQNVLRETAEKLLWLQEQEECARSKGKLHGAPAKG